MDVYAFLLAFHNMLRWVVLAAAVVALVAAARGWIKKTEWSRLDSGAQKAYSHTLGLQCLLGISFFFMPGSSAKLLLDNPGAVIGRRSLQFLAVEHSMAMFVALGVAFMGVTAAKWAEGSEAKHRRSAFYTLISVLLVLAAIPWPFYRFGRPLLRLLGGLTL